MSQLGLYTPAEINHMGLHSQTYRNVKHITESTNLVLWYARSKSAINVNGHGEYFTSYPPESTKYPSYTSTGTSALKLEEGEPQKQQEQEKDTEKREKNAHEEIRIERARNIAAVRWISAHLEPELQIIIDNRIRCTGDASAATTAQQYWRAIVEHFEPRLEDELHEICGRLQTFRADGTTHAMTHTANFLTLVECINAADSTQYRKSFIATIPENIRAHIMELPNFETFTNRQLCEAFMKRADFHLQGRPVPATVTKDFADDNTHRSGQHTVNFAGAPPPPTDNRYVSPTNHHQMYPPSQQYEGHAFTTQHQNNYNARRQNPRYEQQQYNPRYEQQYNPRHEKQYNPHTHEQQYNPRRQHHADGRRGPPRQNTYMGRPDYRNYRSYDQRGHRGNHNHSGINEQHFGKLPCSYCNSIYHPLELCPDMEKQKEVMKKRYVQEAIYALAANVFTSTKLTRMDDDAVTFILDSGATSHFVGSQMEALLLNKKDVETLPIRIADGSWLKSSQIGDMTFADSTDGESFLLEDVRVLDGLAPGLGLISLSQLSDDGYDFQYDRERKEISITRDGKTNTLRKLPNGLFGVRTQLTKNKTAFISTSDPKITEDTELHENETYQIPNLAHERCMHMNAQAIQNMAKSEMAEGMDTLLAGTQKDTHGTDCTACHLGKQKAASFPNSKSQTTHPLQLVHTDVCGPFPMGLQRERYFATFTDDHTDYTVAVPLKTKDEVTAAFKAYVARAENMHAPYRVQTVRSDRGGEYIGAFDQFCTERGIKHEMTAPYTPQQNGKAERMNGTLLGYMRATKHGHDVPEMLWPEVLQSAVYIRNLFKTLVKNEQKVSTWELWWKAKPNFSRLRRYGCLAFVRNLENGTKKMDAKTHIGMLVGYSLTTKGWKIYVPTLRRVIESPHVKFNEKKVGIRQVLKETRVAHGCTLTPEDIPAIDAQDDNKSNMETAIEPILDLQRTTAELGSTANNTVENVDSEEDLDEFFDIHEEHPSGARGHHSIETLSAEYTNNDDSDSSYEMSEPEQEEIAPQLRQLRPRNLINAPDRGIYKYATLADTGNPKTTVPVSYNSAIRHPEAEKWMEAMDQEMQAHQLNGTWELVPRTNDMHVIGNKWVFAEKKDENGHTVRHKARLTGRGDTQIAGVDYEETYSPVVSGTALRIFLSIAATEDLEVHQVDVTTAYLNAELREKIYMKQPQGYENGKNEVCELRKALYGLKQAGREWHHTLRQHLESRGFKCLYKENSCFVMHGPPKTYVLVYVDDMAIGCADLTVLENFKTDLSSRFKITDGGPIHHMLGIKITRDRENKKFILSQGAYVDQMLERFGMSDANPEDVPMAAIDELYKPGTLTEEVPYRAVVGSLLYLSNTTRPDLAFCAGVLGRFSGNFQDEHWKAAKKALRYVKGTRDYGLILGGGSLDEITVFTDADYAGDLAERKSTTGIAIYLGESLVSWKSMKQQLTALSTTEAEMIAATEGAREMLYTKQLLEEMHDETKVKCAMWCDNRATVDIVNNDTHQGRTKHLDTKYQYVREVVSRNKIATMTHIRSEDMVADIFTKPLDRTKFQDFRWRMQVVPPMAYSLCAFTEHSEAYMNCPFDTLRD